MPLRDPHLSLRAHQSYVSLDISGVTWHYITVDSRQVDEARNELTKIALQIPEVTHLFWVDDDMVYPPHALKRLLAHDKPIVGGLCHDRRHPYKPVIARYFDRSWGCDEGAYGWLFDYPDNELIEVDATGGAFLLVKREVFEGIRSRFGDSWAAWWTPIPEKHGHAEDLAFCWQAQRAGYSIHVDTGLDIGHVGEVVVDKEFARRNRAFEYGRWYPPASTLANAARQRGVRGTTDLDSASEKPVASIVITAYNPNPEYLNAAINSALAQTVPCEVIVVDDGSDTRVEVPPGVNLVTHPTNQGISAALNTGVASMTTEWYCWLPCDDLFEPCKVEFQLSYLLHVNGLAGYHGYNLKLDNRNQLGHVPTWIFRDREEQNRALAQGCVINGSTVMVARSVLEKVARSPGVYFDPALRYAQDWDLWRRVGFETLWRGMPDKLATRREFDNLTEKLKRSKDPRKIEEDQIVAAMKVPAVLNKEKTDVSTR
ncbi:MAG: glycosyltransferase [Rhodospirillaceae bacterium]|nr:MAG: glycosyltransferase [Rhodospirillaceae bacterium]